MRLNFEINNELLEQLQARSSRSTRSLDELVEDGLRLLLASTETVELPVFGSRDLGLHVDLEDKVALRRRLAED